MKTSNRLLLIAFSAAAIIMAVLIISSRSVFDKTVDSVQGISGRPPISSRLID